MNNNKKKIAVVDDDRDLLDLLAVIFQRAGFEVRTASNGREFFQLLEKYTPDAVVLDLIMPRMSGEMICQKLREQPAYDKVKVFFLSVVVQPEDKLAAMKKKYKISGYFNKPFPIKELATQIRAAL